MVGMNEKTYMVLKGNRKQKLPTKLCPVPATLKANSQSHRTLLLFVNEVCFSSLTTKAFLPFLAVVYPYLCICINIYWI